MSLQQSIHRSTLHSVHCKFRYFCVAARQSDDIEKMICSKFTRFLMMRAEDFVILRRKPVEVRDLLTFWNWLWPFDLFKLRVLGSFGPFRLLCQFDRFDLLEFSHVLAFNHAFVPVITFRSFNFFSDTSNFWPIEPFNRNRRTSNFCFKVKVLTLKAKRRAPAYSWAYWRGCPERDKYIAKVRVRRLERLGRRAGEGVKTGLAEDRKA